MSTYDINDFKVVFGGVEIDSFYKDEPAHKWTGSAQMTLTTHDNPNTEALLSLLQPADPPPVTLTMPSRKMLYLMGEARRRRFVSPRLAKRMRKEKPNARRFVGVLELPPIAPKDGVREWAVRGGWVR